MPENRFHELLGLPEEVSDPDYYQLLGVDRSESDSAAIEARFKEQMTHIQHIENPRHKEFIEFLKGELKRARSILTDDARRKEYDAELAEERADEIRKILSHMLVDGKLSAVAEISVITEGRNLGLDGPVVRRIVDEELKRAGAQRVSNNGVGGETQIILNKKAQDFARQIQEARRAAKVADTRALAAELKKKELEQQAYFVAEKAREAQKRATIAETDRRRAERQVEVVREKARSAEILAQKAITREHVAAAKIQRSERERTKLAGQVAQSQERLEELVDEANAEILRLGDRGVRFQRLAFAYAAVFVASVAPDALRAAAPALAAKLRGPIEAQLARAGSIAGVVPLFGIALLAIPLHLLAGRKNGFYVFPLLAMAALALAAGLMRS